MSRKASLVMPLTAVQDRASVASVLNKFWILTAGWDVSRESLAKLEVQVRRVPDCELLFLAKVLGVKAMDLFPAKLDLKKLDPALRLKVSTKFPRRKRRR